jgi:hypothetical protein
VYLLCTEERGEEEEEEQQPQAATAVQVAVAGGRLSCKNVNHVKRREEGREEGEDQQQ